MYHEIDASGVGAGQQFWNKSRTWVHDGVKCLDRLGEASTRLRREAFSLRGRSRKQGNVSSSLDVSVMKLSLYVSLSLSFSLSLSLSLYVCVCLPHV